MLLKAGYIFWCFFFGYFVGVLHTGLFDVVVVWPKAADPALPGVVAVAVAAATPLASPALDAQPQIIVPEPAASEWFPVCDGQEEKEDATSLYKQGLLKLPPEVITDPAELRTYRHTRDGILREVPAAVAASNQMFNWCDRDEQARYFSHMPPPAIGFETGSYASLSALWSKATQSPYAVTLHCEDFNARCSGPLETPDGMQHDRMGQESLTATYTTDFIPPKFYPNMSAISALVWGSPVAEVLFEAMGAEDWDKVNQIAIGDNMAAPEVGVIYGGFVTQYGMVFSPHIAIPAWPDEPSPLEWPRFIEEVMGANSTRKWRDVKEVLVIMHHHQEMFWHWMLSEVYRIFVILPFLHANREIYIHIAGGPAYALKYEAMFGLPRSRFISEVNLRADVVYVLQGVERSDVLSIGMAQLAREGMLDLSKVPLDRRRSVLSKLRILEEKANEDVVVKILFIKRTDPFTGRIILNHKEMVKAFQQLGKSIAARYAKQRRGKLRIDLADHLGSMSMVDSRKLFGQADVVIGPHGAGFAHLYGVRAGAHVIEIFAGRHLNMLTAARLGLGYHAIYPRMTKEGLSEGSTSHNFIVDVPFIVGIVEGLLVDRFQNLTTT